MSDEIKNEVPIPVEKLKIPNLQFATENLTVRIVMPLKVIERIKEIPVPLLPIELGLVIMINDETQNVHEFYINGEKIND